jgi:hypothetical protein
MISFTDNFGWDLPIRRELKRKPEKCHAGRVGEARQYGDGHSIWAMNASFDWVVRWAQPFRLSGNGRDSLVDTEAVIDQDGCE